MAQAIRTNAAIYSHALLGYTSLEVKGLLLPPWLFIIAVQQPGIDLLYRH